MHKQLLNVLFVCATVTLLIWIAPVVFGVWNGILTGQQLLTGVEAPKGLIVDLDFVRGRWSEMEAIIHTDLVVVIVAGAIVAIWLGFRKETAASDEAAADDAAGEEAAAGEDDMMADPLGGLLRPVDLTKGQVRGSGPVSVSTVTAFEACDGATLNAFPPNSSH